MNPRNRKFAGRDRPTLTVEDEDGQLVELEIVTVRDGESEQDAVIRQQLYDECVDITLQRVRRGEA